MVHTTPNIWVYGRYVLHLSHNPVVAMVMTGIAGLSFCAHCAILIDEADEFSHKKSENRQLKLVKAHADVEQQVETKLLMCCYK